MSRETQALIKKDHLWYGRVVKVVDGSSVSMPDTEDNQVSYPQPSSQKKGCGFPVMRIVATFHLASGALLELRKGRLAVHERTLWHQMWDTYQAGDVVLADRGFCSYADYWMLLKQKVDCVMRLHQQRKEKPVIQILGKNDHLVQWKKTRKSPKWLTPQQWEKLPEFMTVRHVRVDIDRPGFRTKKVIVATTLLDHKRYPPQAIADLYLRRWMAELFLRDVKTTMNMEVLRCRTTHMIHKELAMFIIAYNLIRFLIYQAALKNNRDPYRISFAGAMQTIRQWFPLLPILKGEKEKIHFIEEMIQILAADILTRRERKRHPRAIKRRPKSYQLLTKPRHEFEEIPHREKYSKKN